MSQNSFPRREHIAALQAAVHTLGEKGGVDLQAEDFGLDRYRCQYRLKLSCPAAGWSEMILVHFQVAEKLLKEGNSDQLNRQINKLLGLRKVQQSTNQ